jgi:glycosyltransferase involved in cell wall biosynthesis
MFGIKRYAVELERALRAQGVDVRPQRILVREVRLGGRPFGGLVTKTLSAALPRRRRDLLHATSHVCNPRRGPAEVVTVHDLIPMLYPSLGSHGEAGRRLDERRLRHALDTARVLVTDTAAVKDELVLHLGADPSRIHPVHLGLRHEVFYREEGRRHPAFRDGRLNVLVAMNLDLRKRADLVLEAAAGLPFVHVVQVGSTAVSPALMARFRALRRSETRLSAEGRLVHLEGIGDGELRRLYSGADLVAHPSAAEGFSFPPLEALACGAPVVASDIPVHREVLGDRARYAPLEAEALARLFEDAWDGSAVRRRRLPDRDAGVAHARTFRWEATAAKTIAAYEQALAGA